MATYTIVTAVSLDEEISYHKLQKFTIKVTNYKNLEFLRYYMSINDFSNEHFLNLKFELLTTDMSKLYKFNDVNKADDFSSCLLFRKTCPLKKLKLFK